MRCWQRLRVAMHGCVLLQSRGTIDSLTVRWVRLAGSACFRCTGTVLGCTARCGSKLHGRLPLFADAGLLYSHRKSACSLVCWEDAYPRRGSYAFWDGMGDGGRYSKLVE